MAPQAAATAAASGGTAGVGSDEFVVMLRHLTEAAEALLKGKGGKAQRGKKEQLPQPEAVQTCGRLRRTWARVEWAVQCTQDTIIAASALLCLGTLLFMQRLVLLNQAVPCLRCGCGRAKGPGQVDNITRLHWTQANVIVQLQGRRRERSARHKAVHEFLSRHRISYYLSIRVRQHVDRSAPEQVRDAASDSPRRLSTEIMVDLLEEMRVPAFSAHPFFVNLRAKHPHLVRELCHEAMQPMLKAPDEIVFCAGEVCSRMYVVISGHVQYCANVQQRDAAGSAPALVRRTLHGGKWLSEAALWTGWVHRGELRAVTDCLLFALDASGFARVISSHKSAHAFAAAYARRFVEGLNRGLQTDLVEAGPIDP